jgi:hypothetical protein
MAAAHFKVKALYAYKSDHDDDLKFPDAQIITVTGEEDADWYIGEYEDAAGELQSGLFPKNFVERFEPAPPPRPTRARPKPAEPPVADVSKEVPSPKIPAASKPKPVESEPSKPLPAVEADETPAPAPVSSPSPAQKPFIAASEPPPAPKPAQATPAKGPPPPVADKSSSIKERLAIFSQGGGAPVAPFQPGGPSRNTFIKKPFVAPPPSLNSYVPTAREPPPQKIYRREEDPEIAQRRADEEDAAKKAGLAGDGEAEEDDAPKLSLKERIALLQKTQAEQAGRRAETAHKEKPKRPPKKRMESHNVEETLPRDSIDTENGEPVRGSSDLTRETTGRPPKLPKSPDPATKDREVFSDANDADQSAAGETTEDAERDSSTEEEGPAKRHAEAPETQPKVGDEEDETEEDEEEEEDEVDEETRRRDELRARMANLSGVGRGMPGMNPFGLPMPGMAGGGKPKRAVPERRPTDDAETSSAASPPQRVPIMAMPGGFGRTMSHESEATIGKEDNDDHLSTDSRTSGIVRDQEETDPVPPPRAPTIRTQGKHPFSLALLNGKPNLRKQTCVGVSKATSRLCGSLVDVPTRGLCLSESHREHERARAPSAPPVRHSNSWGKALARKPISPSQSLQIRFFHSSTSPSDMFLSKGQEKWIGGRLCGRVMTLNWTIY